MHEEYKRRVRSLRRSLETQEKHFSSTLILNPVENVPSSNILSPATSFLHGIYNTDTPRGIGEKYKSKIQFSGRDTITQDVNEIYTMWADLLGAEKLSMRYLSGLHAHTVLFMAICNIGEKVLILPEKAGGHMSSWAILERLGLQLAEIPYNETDHLIDRDKCLSIIDEFNPDVIFVDRSEGLVYEDFSWLVHCSCYKVFDASQYLTNIIAKDYVSPFDMGFDMIVSTLHKNLPGPQRALICTKKDDEHWRRLKKHTSTYVSNMHVFSIYSAGLILEQLDQLEYLSKNMLKNAVLLESELLRNGVPAVKRTTSNSSPPTHHCWILTDLQTQAFDYYLSLERTGILVNYRLLPYGLGYGLRLGLSAATYSGLRTNHIPLLAKIMSEVYKNGYSEGGREQALALINTIKETT